MQPLTGWMWDTEGLQEERQSHPALPILLVLCWPVSSSCVTALLPSAELLPLGQGPSGALGDAGHFWGPALGLCPLCCLQLWTLGSCLHCVGCVSKSPSRPRNSHRLLLCAFLAQKRLIHSLKQINYFCYLKKKKKSF